MRSLDYAAEWTDSNKWRLIDRMRFSDPKIAGLRRAQNLPLLRASVAIEPADVDSTSAVAKADLVRECLIDNFPWRSFVSDACLHLDFGFAPFEVCWRIDEGRVRVDRLALRPPSSIATTNIFVSAGAISRVVQTPVTGGRYEIPGEKLLWFANDKEGDNFVGRSLLRPMHKPWYEKERLEILLPILAEKMGGVPVFTELVTQDETTRKALDDMGESFALGERQYIRKPADVDFALVASHVATGDLLEAIRYFDTQLTAVCQAQYLDLGTQQAGSRALGTTLVDMFSNAVQAQANYIEDVLNAEGGLVHQIVAYNFARDDELPKLRFGNVQRDDMSALAEAFAKLAAAGMPFDEATWDFIRAELNLPESTGAQVRLPGTQPDAVDPRTAPAAPAPADRPGDGHPEGQGAQASEHVHDHELRLADLRAPRGVETCLDLAELVGRYTDAKTALREATQATREALIRELSQRAQVAAHKGQLVRFAAAAPPMVDKLTADIEPVLAEFYAAGAEQVLGELERQHATVSAAEPARRKRVRPDTRLLREQAEATARLLAQATVSAVVAQVMRLGSVAITEAVLREMALRDSDAAALTMHAVVTDLMQAGRAAQAAAVRADVQSCVYSAILDERVCDACAERDGDETNDVDEAASWTPNPACEGGSNCRCMTIYVLKQEA